MQGIVHRDLRPGVIYVYESNGKILVKIAGFGWQRFISTPSAFDWYLATDYHKRYFSCLKHINNEPVSTEEAFKFDIWSLGAILYRLITNNKPFLTKKEIEECKIP